MSRRVFMSFESHDRARTFLAMLNAEGRVLGLAPRPRRGGCGRDPVVLRCGRERVHLLDAQLHDDQGRVVVSFHARGFPRLARFVSFSAAAAFMGAVWVVTGIACYRLAREPSPSAAVVAALCVGAGLLVLKLVVSQLRVLALLCGDPHGFGELTERHLRFMRQARTSDPGTA